MTAKGAIRYAVTARARDEATFARFCRWLADEHGPELLAVAGCLEFRLYEAGPLTASCEYLFASREALTQYFEREAPTMRAKGRAIFSEDEVTFTRQESELLASG